MDLFKWPILGGQRNDKGSLDCRISILKKVRIFPFTEEKFEFVKSISLHFVSLEKTVLPILLRLLHVSSRSEIAFPIHFLGSFV